jgi:signal transduction histidine kinase
MKGFTAAEASAVAQAVHFSFLFKPIRTIVITPRKGFFLLRQGPKPWRKHGDTQQNLRPPNPSLPVREHLYAFLALRRRVASHSSGGDLLHPSLSGDPPLRSQRCALELRDCLAGIRAFLLRDLDNLFAPFLDRFLHLLFSGIFAFLAGFLIDRERQQRREWEKDRYLAGIGQMATTIVHDLKNPLMITILAFSKRIQEGKGNVDKAVHAIWDSAQNMQKIVESILDFARPIQLDIKEEELKGIIDNVVQICKTKAEESGVNLSVQVPTVSMKIATDPHHMERALMNLLANSIEASRAGQDVVIRAGNKGARV